MARTAANHAGNCSFSKCILLNAGLPNASRAFLSLAGSCGVGRCVCRLVRRTSVETLSAVATQAGPVSGGSWLHLAAHCLDSGARQVTQGQGQQGGQRPGHRQPLPTLRRAAPGYRSGSYGRHSGDRPNAGGARPGRRPMLRAAVTAAALSASICAAVAAFFSASAARASRFTPRGSWP